MSALRRELGAPTLVTVWLAQLVVALAGLYLIVLGVAAAVRPALAKRFLEAHASSARVHFLELTLRLLIGVALVVASSRMRGADLALVFGWVLIVTTLALALVPWRAHHRFAEWSVPLATQRMWLIAVGAIAGGAVVLAALVLGPRVA